MSSFSYCIAEVDMDTCAQYLLKFMGRLVDHSTVRLGSGAGPRFSSVCSTRNEFLVTSVLPSTPMPPIDSVTQVGSPENSSLYSFMRINFTMRNFITKWSIISCACSSVSTPRFKSRSIYMSRKVELRPMDIAAPFCSFTAPR